ncbi:hypothetical protein CIW83_02950 [Tissierella sp. P1]|uniref:relaxase/mobilization nuclease domain-containing protein n=1 Tax=Tissierella sp. P1 TaxID=1280483 RepID=UPI000BA16C70|nr:relaxase/mobilization nuclease domain-containing protein [Tissierella sp. P1]OZV13521.1 hypothetical protein CIW83_02950 [Tissierella sp. P1]
MASFIDTEKIKNLNRKKGQTKASLKAVNTYISREDKVGQSEEVIIEELIKLGNDKVFNYVTQDEKTNTKLITGVNCRPSSAYDEMMVIKNMYNKTDGRQFKHFVHSFHSKENITPELAHEISLKLLEHQKFRDFQILVATHVDKEHIHTHYVINTVNIETGLKWQHSTKDLFDITDFSNKLCYEYGLKYSFVRAGKNKTKSKSSGEYRADKEKRSWKTELFYAVKECSKTSISKEDFIRQMNELGYLVRWEDNRKNITFTIPGGRKCNNDKLHPPEKYTKEALLKRFQLNKQWAERTKEFQEKKVEFESNKIIQARNHLIMETIKFLTDNPHEGNKSYPLTYLEGQALKEKMIEKSKGEGLDWEKER